MARPIPKYASSSRVTPLMIIAGFLWLTETVVGVGVISTDSYVQIILALFVVVFPFVAWIFFFNLLRDKPYVFYAPSDYGNLKPKEFMDAIQGVGVPQLLVEGVARVESNPDDEDERFQLIASLIDDNVTQFAIILYEQGLELPYSEFGSNFPCSFGTEHQFVQGSFSTSEFVRRLKGTNLCELKIDGPKVCLNESGKRFAKWLIDNGRKAEWMECKLHSWGTPRDYSAVFPNFHRNAQRGPIDARKKADSTAPQEAPKVHTDVTITADATP
jgi:hypothetical protein